jgi:tetratricopeptide (TPR) repeat protein
VIAESFPTSAGQPPPEPRLWSRPGPRRHLGVLLLLGAILTLAYSNTLRNTEFVLDNRVLILKDPRLREPTAANVGLILRHDYLWPSAASELYRPLTTLSYLFNYSILGNRTHPPGYHLVNLLAHWGNAVLVYVLALVVLREAWLAFFVATVFGVHPITTEAVTNLAGRADLFAAASALAALSLYAKSTTVPGWRQAPWLLGLSAVTAAGVFSKENAVVIPGLMGLYDITYRVGRDARLRDTRQGRASGLARFGLPLVGYGALIPPLVAMWSVRSRVFANTPSTVVAFVDNPLVGTDFWSARLTAITVLGRALGLLVWPVTLSCDYSYDQIPLVRASFGTLADWQAIVALAGLLGVLLVAVAYYRRHKPVFFFLVFVFVAALPTANLLVTIGSILAERFLYLPSVGVAGCLVVAVHAGTRTVLGRLRVPQRLAPTWCRLVAGVTLTLIVVSYGARTVTRNLDWQSDVALWAQAVRAVPDSFKSHWGLAAALYERDPERRELDRIIEEAEKAVAVMEKRPLAPEQLTSVVYLHLGTYYAVKGDTLAGRGPAGTLVPSAQSLLWYRKAADTLVRAVPADRALNELIRRKERARGRRDDEIPDVGQPDLYWKLGRVYSRLGEHQHALGAYRDLQRLAPANPDAYLAMASTYRATGQLDAASVALLQVLLLDGTRTDALRQVADIYRQIDREGCALAAAPTGLAVNPECPIVRRHTCSALAGLARAFAQAKQYTRADEAAVTALRTYGCPSGTLPDRRGE